MSGGLSFTTRLDVVPLAASPEHLQVVDNGSPEFAGLWRQFLDLLPLHGFRYHLPAREYYAMLSAPGGSDKSFVVKSKDGPLAVCPLMIETVGGATQASQTNGGFLPVPLFHPRLGAKQHRALEAFVFEEGRKRLSAAGGTRWLMEADVVSVGTDQLEDLMPARFGALDVSLQCHVMDLTQPEDDLWQQIRHSAKSTINQGLKLYEFKVYDRSNYSPEIGERQRLLHHKCAGRVTRPIPTFHKMNSWIAEGCGLMFEQLHQGKTVQMIIVALGKGAACGASAADDPDFQPKVPLTHSMNFFIYQECRKRGIKYYEVGETTFRDGPFRLRDRKERMICEFKRGFGRQTFPYKRWVWFESPAEETRWLEERLAAYKAHSSTSQTI